MNDREVRVRCIEAAARVPGNPNTVQQARQFYEFVTEAMEKDPVVAIQAGPEEDTIIRSSGKKTVRKV